LSLSFSKQGPPASTKSYLNVPAIVEALRKTGADAVHPGYGFLSENEHFASAVAEAGATFVGPPAHAVRAMGDKVESKRFAKAAGVNTIPGWVGVVEGVDHAISVAKEIGFPVMAKASAGGGGKGMRIAWDEKDLAEGYVLATQEAASAFGDSRMLIEKYVEHPRHVEIQVLGDTHGTVLYLPERECSIQRRNQKVIEEAPSPVVDPSLRKAMGEQAVALCNAVGYFSAGTCEFLVDKHKKFYFLEMNTRLQVEHPITEAVTGLDLVEQMLLVAAGKKLTMTQDDVSHPKGWAVECRVYAEDSARGFLPSTGRLQRYTEPRGHGVRVDSGVEEGSEISMWYDPMISKLVGYGPDRATALQKAARALDSYVIRGVQHNAPLLRSVLDAPDFVAGDFSTAFLAEHFPTPEASAPTNLPLIEKREQEVLALAAALQVWKDLRVAGGEPRRREVALSEKEDRKLVITSCDGVQTPVLIRRASPAMVGCSSASTSSSSSSTPALEIELPERILQISATSVDGALLVQATIDGNEALCQIIDKSARHVTLQYCGAHRKITIDSPAAAEVAHYMPPPHLEDLSKVVRSPMPGVMVSVAVAKGDVVEEGDEVAVVEAMKMRNVLRAGAGGTIASVEVVAGASVAADQVIAKLE
jgi:propionyl-CoA carboxylase alpha chain